MVSIIIPVYNTERFLGEVLTDLLEQTYSDYELIIVDDGSTDNSLDILEEAASHDGRIKVFHSENKGAGSARNLGLDMATGEYVQFLDSDDRFDAQLLEKTVSKADELNTDILMFDVQCFRDGDGKNMFSEWFVRRDKLPDKEVFSWKDCPDTILNLSYSVVWNKLIRRDIIEKCNLRFEETLYGNDIFFVHRIMLESTRISFLDVPLVKYRQDRATALTSDKTRSRDPLCLVGIMQRFYKWLKKSEMYESVRASFLNYAVLCFTGGMESLDTEGFFNMYPIAQRVLFDDFGLSDEQVDKRDPDLKEKIEWMREDEAQEYLFKLMKSYSASRFDMLTWALDEKQLIETMEQRKRWHFDSEQLPVGSRIILYGAGDMGQDYHEQFVLEKRYIISAWVDADYKNKGIDEIESPDVIAEREFDYIVIAIWNKQIKDKVRKYLGKYALEQQIM